MPPKKLGKLCIVMAILCAVLLKSADQNELRKEVLVHTVQGKYIRLCLYRTFWPITNQSCQIFFSGYWEMLSSPWNLINDKFVSVRLKK